MQIMPFQLRSDVVQTKETSTGAVKFWLPTAKEFKESRGLKGQEARRQYNEFIRTHGLHGNQNVVAGLASGRYVIVGGTNNKSGTGGTLRWKDASLYEDKESAFSQVQKLRAKVRELEEQLAAVAEVA